MLLLGRIIRQAKITFDRTNHESYQKNFAKLKELVNGLSYSSLNLHPDLVSSTAFSAEEKAPCTFLSIYETNLFTLTVFILRAGYTMPCHDHPEISGILKVIHGKVQVQSYTSVDDTLDPLNVSMGQRIAVRKEEPKILSATSQLTELSPKNANFHEIQASEEGNAAFFDILSPPYDEESVTGSRKCSFYRRLSVGNEKYFLEKIPAPYSYYCDVVPYELPENVQCDII